MGRFNLKLHKEVKIVKVAVFVKNGQIMPADPALQLKEMSCGELTILASAVIDESKRIELSTQKFVEILPANTMLLIVMKPGSGLDNYCPEDIGKVLTPELLSHIYDPRQYGEAISTGTDGGIFLPIILLEPLKIELRGDSKEAKLIYCHCAVPALNRDAHSPNHAYTLLSQVYEPRRMSHTGNAFTKVYYLNRDKKAWEQLDQIRYIEECMK
jgi:hypothetical protein